MKKLLIYAGKFILRFGLILAFMVGSNGMALGQTTLARFQLNGNLNVTNDNAVGTPSASNSGMTFSTNNMCEGSGHLYADANTDYIDIFINTSGFRSITLSWQQRLFTGTGSGSGTNIWNFYADYDNDGTDDYALTNNAAPTSSCATITMTLPASFDYRANTRFRIQRAGTGSRTIYLDDIYIRGTAVPQYLAQFTAMDFGSTTWCAGETRNVSVTVRNIGTATWTNATPDINIGLKWNSNDPNWLDYHVRVDANGLTPGSTGTYSLPITSSNNPGTGYTAPLATGSNNLTFDVVYEGICWFGNNGGTCGPGNTVYTSPAINIVALPSFSVHPSTSATSYCLNGTASALSVTAAAGSGSITSYQWYSNTLNSNSGGTPVGTSSASYTPSISTSGILYYYCIVTNSNGCTTSSNVSGAITVLQTVNAGTVTSADETFCGGSNNPANIIFSTPPSGGAGTFSFQWYYQDGIVSCPAGAGTTGWTPISGATSNSYDPPAGLTASRTYAVQVNPTGTPDCGVATWAANCRKVTVNLLPTFNYTQTNLSCNGATDGKISINASGGSGGYQYRIFNGSAWTGWQSSNLFENLSAITYTLEVKDSNGCLQTLCP